VLHARLPVGAAALGRRETRLVRVLAQQAASWLSTADLVASRDAALTRVEAVGEAAKALGDLGAHTTPTLGVLRDSANRLAKLAGSADTAPHAIDGIVDELHTVERAVASLLGAIALAAEPDLTSPLPRPRSGQPGHSELSGPEVRSGDGWVDNRRGEPDWTASGTLS
jgi:hypothetical protein